MTVSFNQARNLGLSLLVGVVAALGLMSLVASNRTIERLTAVIRETQPILSRCMDLRDHVEASQYGFLRYVSGQEADTVAIVAHLDTATERARELEGLVGPADREEVRRFARALSRFRETAMTICSRAGGSADLAAARRLALVENRRLVSSIKALSARIQKRITLALSELVRENLRVQRASILFVTAGVLFSLLVAVVMSRALQRPGRLLLDGLKSMGRGDLTRHIEIRSGDIFEKMAHAFNEMADKRRQAEEALAESERKYRELVQNANSIVLKMDREGRITFFNEFAQSFFGYSESEILGRHVVGTIVPETESSGRDLRAFVDSCCADPERYKNNENENIKKSGERVWISWTNRAIRDEKGEVVGILCVGNDITQRKRLEDQLMQSLKMEAIGCLAGGVAHDFNNLLTAIVGYSDLILASLRAGDPLSKDIGEIKKAAEKATSLTRQLMAFSRRQSIQPQVLDLNSVIRELKRMLQRIAGGGRRVVFELAPRLARVRADRAKLEHVLMNLVANSRDATPPGGTITVATSDATIDRDYSMAVPEARPGRFVCVRVTDNGRGMPKDILERIFDPFFSTKGPDKGAGMGLAIVYGHIKQHGGWITASSEPGKGATFEFYLPAWSTSGGKPGDRDAGERSEG